MSDISKVFELDDIMILPEDITASGRWGFGEKTGNITSALSYVGLLKSAILVYVARA
jgi:hypothetical protein